MISEEDKAYYCRRAEEEIARAQAATDERGVSVHYQLAGYYLDRAYGDGSLPVQDDGSRIQLEH